MAKFDGRTEQVYRSMLAHPDWGVSALSAELNLPEQDVHAALDQLFDLDLLSESFESGGQPHALDLHAGLRAALVRQEELAESQAQAARLLSLRLHTDVEGIVAGHGMVQRLDGMDAVQDRLATLATETSQEVFTFMPGGAQSPAVLAAARQNDAQILKRGVRIRTVGLDSIRNDPATLEYALWLTESGGQFRTTSSLRLRMVLADHRSALIPIDPLNTRAGALYVTEPGVIICLSALFDEVWARAVPLGDDLLPEQDGLSRQERAALELLATGLTDEAAASRLGISPRSTRRIMADLMERLGAHSRFEAGLKCAQRGWL